MEIQQRWSLTDMHNSQNEASFNLRISRLNSYVVKYCILQYYAEYRIHELILVLEKLNEIKSDLNCYGYARFE